MLVEVEVEVVLVLVVVGLEVVGVLVLVVEVGAEVLDCLAVGVLGFRTFSLEIIGTPSSANRFAAIARSSSSSSAFACSLRALWDSFAFFGRGPLNPVRTGEPGP